MAIIDKLEAALQALLNTNADIPIYLIDLYGEIDARSKGRWGIGVHFEDSAAPGAVRHSNLFIGEENHEGLSQELAEALKRWVTEVNLRLQLPRPPRIELTLTG